MRPGRDPLRLGRPDRRIAPFLVQSSAWATASYMGQAIAAVGASAHLVNQQ